MRQQTTKGATVNILNIGLQRNDGGALDPRAVLAELIGRRVVIASHAVYQSDTEATLVIECDWLPSHRVHALCDALAQDCIATWEPATGAGRLIGPKAADWGGVFVPEFFILPNGERLA